MTEKQHNRPCKLPGRVYLFQLKGACSICMQTKIKSSHEALCREFVYENKIDKLWNSYISMRNWFAQVMLP